MAAEFPITSDLSLEQLPDVERTFYFTDPQKLGQDIWDFLNGDRDSLRDYTVLVKKILLESLDTDDEDHIIPSNCRILYLENHRDLFITMTSSPHETVSQTFGDIMCKNFWLCIATKNVRSYLDWTGEQKTDKSSKNARPILAS